MPACSRTSGSMDGGGGRPPDVVASVFRGTVNRMQSGYILRDVLDKVGEIHFSSSEEIHTLSHLYESMLKEMRDAAGDSGEFYTPRPLVQMIVTAVDPQPGRDRARSSRGHRRIPCRGIRALRPHARPSRTSSGSSASTLYGIEAKPLPYLLCQMNLLLHGVESPQIDPLNALRFSMSEIGDRDRVDVIVTNPPFGGEEEKGIQRNFPEDRQTSETALLFLQLIMRKLHREPPGRAAVLCLTPHCFIRRWRRECAVICLRSSDFARSCVCRREYSSLTRTSRRTCCSLQQTDRATTSSTISCDRRTNVSNIRRLGPSRPPNSAEFLELARAHSADSPNAWMVQAKDVLSEPICSLDIHNPKEVADTAEDPHAVLEKLTGGLSDVRSRLDSLSVTIATIERIVTAEAGWQEVRLDDVLTRRKDVVDIRDDLSYKRLRIQVKGRGVLLRDEVMGATIGTKRQFQVETGQFVLSKIDARNGAFGIVPEVCDGAVITGNFWAYDVEDDVMRSRLLHYLTFSDAFIRFCTVSSPGATNRRYLQENLFLDQVTRIPQSVSEQDELCDALDAIAGEVRTQENTLATLAKRIQSCCNRLFTLYSVPARASPHKRTRRYALDMPRNRGMRADGPSSRQQRAASRAQDPRPCLGVGASGTVCPGNDRLRRL